MRQQWIVNSAGAMIISLYGAMFLTVFIKHYYTLQVDKVLYWSFVVFTVSLVLAPLFCRSLTLLNKWNRRHVFLALLLICLAVKVTWVVIHRTEPANDFLTFHRTASMLAEGWQIQFKYVALFPHIMGYASFLSLFYALFGTGPLVAPIVNAVLSTVSMGLIHCICEKLFHPTAAVMASLIWILYPSQTIYNALVFSEPLYKTLILAFLAFAVRHLAR